MSSLYFLVKWIIARDFMKFKKNMMIRTFHSIGQGAFYTEDFFFPFLTFKVVYDCGTDSGSIKSLNKYVDTSFQPKEKIDIIFVSHFHRDHINGLEHLLLNYIVDYVFIPQYEIADTFLNFMCTSRDLNSFMAKITLDPVKAIKSISESTKVIFVEKYNLDNENTKYTLNMLTDGCCIQSGDTISIEKYRWFYVPVNYNKFYNTTSFRLALQAENINSVNDFISAWKCKRKRKYIANSFAKLKGNQNENSMVVYSGPRDSGLYTQHLYKYPICTHDKEFKFGAACIYYGDYEVHDEAWKVIDCTLGRYFKHVGVVQIPHHGASKNYRDEINGGVNIYSVISHGLNNRYGHPHSFTTSSIIKNNGILLRVTENPSTRLNFIITPLINDN